MHHNFFGISQQTFSVFVCVCVRVYVHVQMHVCVWWLRPRESEREA